MYTLLTILLTVVLGFAVSAACYIAVLSAVIRRERWSAGAIASLLPPYLFYRGWRNVEQLRVAGWMRLWTAATGVVLVLMVLLEQQMG